MYIWVCDDSHDESNKSDRTQTNDHSFSTLVCGYVWRLEHDRDVSTDRTNGLKFERISDLSHYPLPPRRFEALQKPRGPRLRIEPTNRAHKIPLRIRRYLRPAAPDLTHRRVCVSNIIVFLIVSLLLTNAKKWI